MDIKQKLSIPFQATKKMLFSSYYNFIDCQFSMTYLYVVIIIVEYFQHLNLIQFNMIYSTSLEELHHNYPFVATTLVKVRNILLLYPSANFKVAKIIICVLLALFLFQIILVLVCKQVDITKPKPLYQSILFSTIFFLQILYAHVLTIPILITLFSVYQCQDSFMLNYPSISCGQGDYYIFISISSITLCCFSIIALLNTFLFTDINPISKCPFASSNYNNRFLSFVLEVTLCLFYIISPLMNQIKGYVVFSICLIKFIVRFYNMNFYNRRIGWMFMTFDTGELFLSITSILNNNKLYLVTLHNTVLEIIISTLLGISINSIIWYIRKKILLSPLSSIKSHYQIMTKIMMLIDYASEFYIDDYKRNMFMGLLHYHRFNCHNNKCKCEAYAKVLNKYKKVTLFKPINMYTNNVYLTNKAAVIDGNVPSNDYDTLKEDDFDDKDASSYVEQSGTVLSSVTGNDFSFNVETNTKETEINHKANESLVNTETSDLELSEADCIYGFIKLNIDNLLVKKHNLMLNMVLSYIMKNKLSNYFKGLFEMMKLMKKNQSFSNEFSIFSFKARIEKTIYEEYKNNINQNLSIETVLEYNEISNKIVDDMKEISREMAYFWGIITFSFRNMPSSQGISAPKVKLDQFMNDSLSEGTDIYSCAITASKNIEKLRHIYEKMLINKHFINKKVLYIYIMFLLKVIANHQEAEVVKERLLAYETEHNSIFVQLSYQHDELYRLFRTMDRVGILIISGDILSIGKILSANHQFCTIFNYPKDEISRDTVNKIVPSFISQYHDEFMYRFLETSKKHILNKLRIVFGLSKEGVLIPIYLYVKAIPDLSQSVRFIGIIKELNKEHPFLEPNIDCLSYCYEITYTKTCFMLVNQKGDIFGVNKTGLKKFGIPLNLLHITNDKEDVAISVHTIFPSSNIEEEAVKSKLASDEGLIMRLDSRNIKHLFNDYKESLIDSSSPIKKIMSKMDDEEVFKEHTVYCHSFQLCFNEGQVPVQILKIVLIQKLSECLFEDSDYLNMSMGKRKIRLTRKPTLLKFSTADYLDSETKNNAKGSNDKNTKQHLINLKNKLTVYSVPNSIKLFSLMMALFMFAFFMLSLSEYCVVTLYSKKIMRFVDNYINCMIRNYYFSIVILDFRYLTLIDNEILSMPLNSNVTLQRDILVNLLKHDLNITIDYNHKIGQYLTYLMIQYPEEIDFYSNVLSFLLGSDFKIETKEEHSMFILDYTLVRIVDMTSYLTTALLNKGDLFYYNPFIKHTPPPEHLLKEIFYIHENSLRVTRYEMEKIVYLFNYLNRFYRKYINIDTMVYICIPTFIVVVFGVGLFYFLLKRVADYKMTILRIFHLIDGNYGVNAMQECLGFISELEKSVMHLDKISKKAFNDMKMKKINTMGSLKEIKDNQSHSARSRNPKNVLSALVPSINTNSNSNNNQTNNNTSDKLFDGSQFENASNKPLNNSMTNEQKYIEHSIAFWRFDKTDDEIANAIKEKKNYMVRQLNKSKKNFWSRLFLIYFSLIILFVIILIYTSVAMGLNIQFKSQGMNQAANIYNICTRGWSFVNLLLFSWDIIIANSKTPSSPNLNYTNFTLLSTKRDLNTFDLYSLYLNQTDLIENYILFLSTKDLHNSDKDILGAYKQMEIDLNSDKYCSLLKEYDSKFYEEYQSGSCDDFYLHNKGLKDSIKIVYFQIKNNFPDYDPSKLNTMIKTLNVHEAFIYDVLIFTTRAILMQMGTLEKNLLLYGDKYNTTCLIRFLVFTCVIIIESFIWVYIILNLIQILNKDKAILTLLPFESLIINHKLIEILNAIKKN